MTSEILQTAAASNLLKTSYWNYSEQLEDFIARYKTRPPDIKFWPYGPYWPKFYEDEVQETPKHLDNWPSYVEPLLRGPNRGKCYIVQAVQGHWPFLTN